MRDTVKVAKLTVRRPPIIVEQIAEFLTTMTVVVSKNTGGSCIPHCYILAAACKHARIPVKIVETEFRLRAIGDARPSMSYPNKKTGFLGHTLVYLPTRHFLIDASLHTQISKVIPLAMPSGGPVFMDFDHRVHNSAHAELERGYIEYTNIRHSGNAWHKANMPWKAYDKLGKMFYDQGLRLEWD